MDPGPLNLVTMTSSPRHFYKLDLQFSSNPECLYLAESAEHLRSDLSDHLLR